MEYHLPHEIPDVQMRRNKRAEARPVPFSAYLSGKSRVATDLARAKKGASPCFSFRKIAVPSLVPSRLTRPATGGIVSTEGSDRQPDRQTSKPRWTRGSVLSVLIVFGIFAGLLATCGGDSEPERRPAPRRSAPVTNVQPPYEELAGTIWSCGSYSNSNPNQVVMNILALSDQHVLILAEDLAYELEEGLIPERDFAAGMRVLQLILSCKGWD